MRIFLFVIFSFIVSLVQAQPDTLQQVVPNRRNAPEQQQKPYVILISADGFRHDYMRLHGAPYLQAMASQGVQARYMMPAYPSLTFPNHYTLATGLHPSHHGLVDNYFYAPQWQQHYSMKKRETVRDGKWYGGTPLWVLAEQQGLLAASYFWVGSEADVQGVPPTYRYFYNTKTAMGSRIQTVADWLQLPEDQRPHLILFYMQDTDDAGHDYGPLAPETGAAVRRVDSVVRALTDVVQKTGLPVNFIFTSDHGMTRIENQNTLRVPVLDSAVATVSFGGELTHVYVKHRDSIKTIYQRLRQQADRYQVLLKSNMPRRLHYGDADDRFQRIGDILLVPEWPYVFARSGHTPDPGAHGYDPYRVKDMRTVFYAWGPAFRKNKTIPALNNVDVFPIVAQILGLPYNFTIDGSKKATRRALR